MIATIVTIYVKSEYADEFIKATIKNHEGTRKEKGNIRFDFIRCKSEPTKFVLYEVFESEAAIEEHKKTPHYNAWRDAVVDWMAKPREGVKHDIIAPLDREAWS